ncbi:hypothetical protein CDD83_10527 [Cordyceps sp. RAO-2017]|nr:hypothetical protein CDD83_10527 [Cordyceps sp. RAO-2017]
MTGRHEAGSKQPPVQPGSTATACLHASEQAMPSDAAERMPSSPPPLRPEHSSAVLSSLSPVFASPRGSAPGLCPTEGPAAEAAPAIDKNVDDAPQRHGQLVSYVIRMPPAQPRARNARRAADELSAAAQPVCLSLALPRLRQRESGRSFRSPSHLLLPPPRPPPPPERLAGLQGCRSGGPLVASRYGCEDTIL